MRNGYRKGAQRERRSAAILEASGYTVFRCAGSHGLFDLVAVSNGGLLLVQVKSRDWPSTVDLEAMAGMPTPANCIKLIHRWRDWQRYPDVREVT